MQIPYKWIAIGIAIAFCLALLSVVVWSPASVTGNTMGVYVKNGIVPISGATVRITGPTLPPPQTTGANGFVQFTGLDAGIYAVRVISDAGSALQTVSLSASTIITIDLASAPIVLPGAGVLRGTTHSQDGNIPLPGVLITATNAGGEIQTTSSDSNSDYTIELDEGTYVVKATYQGYSSIQKTISIVTNSEIIQNFLIINAAATLNLRIKDSWTHVPIEYAKLIIGGNAYTSTALGIIYIAEWAKGSYDYSLSCTNYLTITDTLTVEFGYNDITIEMVRSSVDPPAFVTQVPISGHIMKSLDNAPIMNAKITVTNSEGVEQSTITIADGSFSLVVWPGTYALKVTAIGFKDTEYVGNRFTVASGDSKTIDIRMDTVTTPPPPPEQEFNWLPLIILGAIGGIVLLISAYLYSTRGNPVYISLGFVAFAICLIIGLLFSMNLISYDSAAVITEAIKWK